MLTFLFVIQLKVTAQEVSNGRIVNNIRLYRSLTSHLYPRVFEPLLDPRGYVRKPCQWLRMGCLFFSYTTQICTLPITVKGIPKDNEVTLDCHLEECEGDPKCGCKDRIVLNKNDMARCRFNLFQEETAIQTLLTQQIFWDLCTIITTSFTLHDLLNDAIERSTIVIKGNEIFSLENSFQDLIITEDPYT
ncbi:hypothetical protein CHS0354_042168 [Potamilus streckersoni]|uniref:Uncharacterized protein n=1 Tax=Potamilus streckersoni TaxID=2493646 RepID=A0AAE0TNH3_9BIVA|nr:hypothetical protein CHS0354_042168 [Potamilus streckersoni]